MCVHLKHSRERGMREPRRPESGATRQAARWPSGVRRVRVCGEGRAGGLLSHASRRSRQSRGGHRDGTNNKEADGGRTEQWPVGAAWQRGQQQQRECADAQVCCEARRGTPRGRQTVQRRPSVRGAPPRATSPRRGAWRGAQGRRRRRDARVQGRRARRLPSQSAQTQAVGQQRCAGALGGRGSTGVRGRRCKSPWLGRAPVSARGGSLGGREGGRGRERGRVSWEESKRRGRC